MNRENKRKTFEKGYYKTHACHDRAPQAAAKCAEDFFAGKSDAESQKHNRPVQ